MIKFLHCCILLLCFFLFPNITFSQNNRVDNSGIPKQTVEVTSTSVVNAPIPNNIPEKQAQKPVHNNKTDSLISKKQQHDLTPNADAKYHGKNGATNNSTQRTTSSKNENITDDNKTAVDVNAPLFPDFNVTATKEEPYENKVVLKEKAPQKLENIKQPLPEDNITTERSSNTTNNVTISPSKRKYLEGIVADLEKEIQANPNSTSIDIQAKKKELQELKELLAK